MTKAYSLLASLAGATLVAAHGHVSHIIVNGVYYENYNPSTHWYQTNPPKVIGWRAEQIDNGFVEPNNFGTADIICHRQATPGGGHATVAAGDKISIVWDPVWPESHIGPVIDYLAACNGDCETTSKESLQWFKIDGAGYDATTGLWAADALRANGNSWLVQIPATLKAGNYVLRHEIIALHGASSPNGAQAYPQCVNLRVTGSGSSLPAGVPGTSLYTATDPGILFNPWTSDISYPVPGPALIPGAVSSIPQSKSTATATASATLPGGAQPTVTAVSTTSTSKAVTPVPHYGSADW
ncbi:glycoside hydrolase 61 [Collariella sp. IMI 366227]|nr:glycoside hydrolase 61 [Collariella sp. IMI 366227]